MINLVINDVIGGIGYVIVIGDGISYECYEGSC